MVLYGDTFRDAELITRLTSILAFCLSLLVENRMMEHISESEALLDERSGRQGTRMQDSTSLLKACEDLSVVEAVTAGRWELIPTINDRILTQGQVAQGGPAATPAG